MPTTITRPEIAQAFRVHEKTISRWVREGRLPPPLPVSGRTLRWRRADIVALLGEPEAA